LVYNTMNKRHKKLSVRAIRARTLHDAFLWMLFASVNYPQRFDAGEIIGKYWSYTFNNEPLQEEDFNDTLVDRIREQLLIKGGAIDTKLHETKISKFIKSQLIFTEEN